MSITSSMYTGAAGLRAHSDAMDVVSDNIANVNTIGFKKSRADFADVLGGVIAGKRAGAGSMVAGVSQNFTQGALLGTGQVTDLAIRGDGFFVVSGMVDGVRGTFYTRDGQFNLDQDGYLENAAGLRLQGYPIDANGQVTTTVGDIQIDMNALPPQATTQVELVGNLDAEQPIDATPFDITDPAGTSDFSTTMTVYDSLGTPRELQFYFKKLQDTPTPQWEYHVVAAGTDVDPPPPGDYALLGTGTLDFNTDGSLANNSLSSVTVSWEGAASATIAIDLGSPTSGGGTGVDGITTYASPSGTTFLSQDGYGSGDLAGITINDEGLIEGQFTNGQTRALAQIATAKFANNQGLERRGDGLFAQTRASGEPAVGTAGSGGRGALVSGSLENSNVDMAEEFVHMIAIQRGFQSNSRTISTADEMLADVVQLKR